VVHTARRPFDGMVRLSKEGFVMRIYLAVVAMIIGLLTAFVALGYLSA
jgi:hypothetical protein